MQKALKTQLAAVDFQKLQQEMQELKTKQLANVEKEMAQARRDMEKNSMNLEETMKDARRQMQAAQEELQLMKKGIDELIKDGIVKKDEPADIEWEGDTLLINGKAQPAEVSKKYEAYFKKGKFSFNGKSPKIVL
jgi:septal ring factor EnvC (AmiA/AmiB activator)